ncbi:MAG: hypothetical protein Q4B36_06190 [Tissierellia bacterium]|nr:hypothetical protein [Tissierellia bacterium]
MYKKECRDLSKGYSIKDFSINVAINRLIDNGAKLVEVGSYKSYELYKKYDDKRRIEGKVLILPSEYVGGMNE